MSVEDRVRAAATARAELVRDIRPLELPAARPARLPFEPQSRRWLSRLTPVIAAAVVVALAVALVSIRHLVGPQPAPAPISPATAIVRTVPEFYAEIVAADSAIVGDDRTGAVLATISAAPGSTFGGVAAAADDRTFVLDSQAGDGTHTWYRLRLDPGGAHPARLSRLPIAPLPGRDQIDGLALSPDGRELAVFYQPWASYQAQGPTRTGPPGSSVLLTYSLATGQALHRWTAPPTSAGQHSESGVTTDNLVNLTWLADGRTLGFQFNPYVSPNYERTLTVTGAGTDLIADSRPVLAVPGAGQCEGVTLSADGRTIICGTSVNPANGECNGPQPEFDRYPVSTGKRGLLYRYRYACTTTVASALWARSGASAIGAIVTQPASGLVIVHVGVLTPGRFTPLDVRTSAYLAATPGSIAF